MIRTRGSRRRLPPAASAVVLAGREKQLLRRFCSLFPRQRRQLRVLAAGLLGICGHLIPEPAGKRVLYRTLPLCAVLRCAMLCCCAMLCYAVFFCAVLCCAFLLLRTIIKRNGSHVLVLLKKRRNHPAPAHTHLISWRACSRSVTYLLPKPAIIKANVY